MHPEWTRYLLSLGFWGVLAGLAWLGQQAFPSAWTQWLPALALGLGGGWMLLFDRSDPPGEGVGLLKRGAAFMLAAGALWQIIPDSTTTRVPWHVCTPEALETARREQRPVMIGFFADHCMVCERFTRKVLASEAVAAAAAPLTALRVDLTYPNAPLSRPPAEQFKVTRHPTLVFLGPDGLEREDLRLDHYENARLFRKRLESLAPPRPAPPPEPPRPPGPS